VSNVVSAACWPLQMSATQKAVLMALADNASDHGVCWPSIPTLCIKTCLAKSTVITALQALESAGLLVADRATGRVNKYQIVPTLDLFPRDKPVRELDRSGSRTGTTAGPNPSGSRTGPVREPDPNHKEPSRTEKQKQPQAALPDPPEWVDRSAWDGFVEMRKRIRYPLTPRAAELVWRELDKLRPQFDPDDVLDQSTRNAWRDVFPIRSAERARAGPLNGAESKTLTGMKALQGMKDGLVQRRNNRRPDEAHVLELGQDASRRPGTDHGGDVD
jgi:hypothetical protein